MPVRDIVVIGGSAGAVEGSLRLLSLLPAALPARLFLVIHVPPMASSALPRLITRGSRLEGRHPAHGERTKPSTVYVAPPDYHLILHDGHVATVRGPRENGHRPAVDPLFRSAAAQYGERVIGIVLSGTLDDGSAGLRAIADAGGIAIVQDPAESVYTGMPTNALQMVPDAEVLRLSAIAARIVQLTAENPNGVATGTTTAESAQEDPVEMNIVRSQALSESGEASNFTCPECHGAIFHVDAAGVPAYRCRVGHAYSAESLLAAQNGSLEAALWAALRALEEGSEMAGRLAHRAEERGSERAARQFRRSQVGYQERAKVIRQVLDVSDHLSELNGDDEHGKT